MNFTGGGNESLYRIKNILNNNAVIASMDGTDVILTGSGVGYNRKRKDIVDPEKIQKVYKAQSEKQQTIFSMVQNLDRLYLDLATQIVEMAEEKTRREYTPFLLVELADHIASAIERNKNGVEFFNLLDEEMKILYADEFEVGCWALDLIEAATGYRICSDEAGFVALHLISSRAKKADDDLSSQVSVLVGEILKIVEKHFDIEIQSSQISHVRLMTHLKFLATRILTGKEIESADMETLYDMLRSADSRSDAFISDLRQYLESEYSYHLNNDEMFYLLVHLNSILGLVD